MDGNRVAVVGGGLAGLAAALYLARAGRRVTLFEAAPVLGGRGGTLDRGGFSLNMGPHALYRGGAAMAVLRELGLEPAGSPPPSTGLVGEPGHWQRLPASGMDLLRTGALSLRGKMEWVGRLTALAKPEQAIAEWRGRSAQAWLDTVFRHEDARRLAKTFFHVATYTADLETLDAAIAIRQLSVGLKGVLYLDGGWGQMVDGLSKRAREAGVDLRLGAPVTSVHPELRLADGTRFEAAAVVLAVTPGQARRLCPVPDLLGLEPRPARVASLDLALSRWPNPNVAFALGHGEPVYFAVHSSTARVAPAGGALVHAMRYLRSGETGDRAELEAWVDQLQPGWRAVAVQQRFSVFEAVSHTGPRPPVILPGAPGVFLAGDWVGEEGWLLDASLASAKAAALGILEGGAAAA